MDDDGKQQNELLSQVGSILILVTVSKEEERQVNNKQFWSFSDQTHTISTVKQCLTILYMGNWNFGSPVYVLTGLK